MVIFCIYCILLHHTQIFHFQGLILLKSTIDIYATHCWLLRYLFIVWSNGMWKYHVMDSSWSFKCKKNQNILYREKYVLEKKIFETFFLLINYNLSKITSFEMKLGRFSRKWFMRQPSRSSRPQFFFHDNVAYMHANK